VDGVAKVTGQARYASDEPVANPAYACLVTSAIARGRVRALHLGAARAVPGVVDILTHDNVGALAKPPSQMSGGATTTTLESDRVWHDGQIIAVVVADTFEAASEAASRVRVDYAVEAPGATFDSPGVTIEPHKTTPERPDPRKGDAAAALAGAAVKIADPAPQPHGALHHHLRLGWTAADHL
jgi:xanthine dehydrogenase YagR molybdenum-binding subunit